MQGPTPQTPYSPQNLRFVVDQADSYGPPNISGVENLHTQYREDKRLRVHETPFEIRLKCQKVLERDVTTIMQLFIGLLLLQCEQ